MSLKEFPIIQKLGEGAYSSVYKVKRVTDENEYALKKVKLMNLSEKEKLNALNEVRILASIRQPNIIGYKEAFVDEVSNSLCIVMEYADNGDLYQKIVDYQKKGQLFPEQEIWNIFIQITKGLKALHGLQIYHRDLKSANVFLNKEGLVKLGDMNVSKVAKQGLLYTQTGTPYYASPEVWKDQPYDSKSDIWSLGCVLYEMTTLKPPFRAEDMEGLYKKVIRGYYPRIPPHFSQDLANIIRSLLQVSPHLRPSCDKILGMPSVMKRISDNLLMEVDENSPVNLLNTIKIPKNLHYLTDRLPKPNYEPLKARKVDKRKFLQTLAGYRDVPSAAETPSPEQMKQLVLPKIPNSNNPPRKNHHASSMRYEDDDFPGDISIINDDQAVSVATSQPQRANPRTRSRKVVNRVDGQQSSSVHSSGQQQQISQQQSLPKYSQLPQGINHYSDISGKGDASSSSNKQLKVLDIHALKQKYDLPTSYLQQVQTTKPRKKELSPLKKKLTSAAPNLLDIEGESKPLQTKGKRIQSNDKSMLYDDTSSLGRLPAIQGSKLPKIYSGAGASNNILGLGVNGAARSLEIENPKIKEITKAYRVNLDPMANEVKERNRQVKKSDRSKLQAIKTPSVPAGNNQGGNSEKYAYIYAGEGNASDPAEEEEEEE